MHSEHWIRHSAGQVIRRHKKRTILLGAVIIGAAGTSLLPPLVLEQIVNRLSQHQAISFSLAAFYLLLIVLADGLTAIQNAWITIFGQKLTHEIRSALCAKLDRLPADYYHHHPAGRITSLFINDGDAIDVLYSDGVISMFADSLRVIAILWVIFTRSTGLGLLILAVLPVLYVFTRICRKRIRQAQLDNRRAIAKVNNHVPETLRCMRMIRTLHVQRYMERSYDEAIRESYQAMDRSNFIDSIYSPVILFVQACLCALMMVLAVRSPAWRAWFGISVGSAVAMMAYISQIFSPLENIGMEIQNIQAAAAAIRHMEEFFNEPNWQPRCTDPIPKSGILLDHVTFGYDPARPVIRDLSFTVRPNEIVTLTGRTGAGKSTIFRLLTGLYQPQHGSIYLAGQCPCAIPEHEKRKIYGCVEQDFPTVPGTVRDQITLYDGTLSDKDVLQALKLAGLKDTVDQLPQGLDTPMHEELFSQGQMQMLAIARAVVADPQVLLLDEITANLDAQTEAQIIQALKEASANRTVLSVSHRISSAIGADRTIEIPTLDP
ncbi:MAG: ABC transporter ATP-binding protein [Catenisphaera adipataccumulans]|uniref:ABC transporter ATP-binding protein n=1 Tax=Catenisphaera adipataccumulans TaxID=700500 RepID=UPI003D8F3356